ncbi:MAG: adenosylhomocysteinase [Negativicutes bacterium]|nr:adenosylhomocysteinase [Negativicutes bacterium]
MQSLVRDMALAPQGMEKINWVKEFMPVLNVLSTEFIASRPLAGKKVAVTMHLEAKTAYLALLLQQAGADVAVTGSNPLSTQDDVAAALASQGVKVFAWYDCTAAEYDNFLHKALDTRPDIIVDDGGDLVALLHGERSDLAANILGGSEETTTGVIRLRALEAEGRLKFPMVAVNDTYCKYLFDNRYGTGQSTWDGIMRSTNLTVAGKTVVVAGYGWCGKGVAMRAKGLGANVIITEIDPVKAIEAVFDGFKVLPMQEAARVGDFFVTLTGCIDVIRAEHIKEMKHGAILANAGHFDVEINKADLNSLAVARRRVRRNVEEFCLADGRKIYLLAEGRLVNLAAGDGHPTEIMDLSFALQALSVIHIANNYQNMPAKVYEVPPEVDSRVAALKLKAMGIDIDQLSPEQAAYLSRA